MRPVRRSVRLSLRGRGDTAIYGMARLITTREPRVILTLLPSVRCAEVRGGLSPVGVTVGVEGLPASDKARYGESAGTRPARAIRCACATRGESPESEWTCGSGLHTGEIELPLNPGRLRCGSPSARAVLCEHGGFRQALAQFAAAQR